MGLHVMGAAAQGGEAVKESAKDSAASAKDYLEQKLGRIDVSVKWLFISGKAC